MQEAALTFSLSDGAEALWAEIELRIAYRRVFLCLAPAYGQWREMMVAFDKQAPPDRVSDFSLAHGEIRFADARGSVFFRSIAQPQRWISVIPTAAWVCPFGDYRNWPDRLRTRLAANDGKLIVTEFSTP